MGIGSCEEDEEGGAEGESLPSLPLGFFFFFFFFLLRCNISFPFQEAGGMA